MTMETRSCNISLSFYFIYLFYNFLNFKTKNNNNFNIKNKNSITWIYLIFLKNFKIKMISFFKYFNILK